MNVEFHIGGLKADEHLRGQVASDLNALNDLIPIANAHVSLQRQREVTPAYQAVAMLAVPGPDIHAAARDHTWPAAWQKALARLHEQIEERRARQAARRKREPCIHTPVRRPTSE